MSGKLNKNKFLEILNRFYLWIVLIVAILFFSIASPAFLTWRNLTNIFVQNTYLIIATIGIMLIMISGGADLSVSYQMGLASVVMGKMLKSGVPTVWVVITGLAVGIFLGFINGYFTVLLKVHPMVTTLATMTIFQGVAWVISGQLAFSGFPESFKWIGQHYFFGLIPVSFVIMLVMVALAYFMLNKTYFGRYIYALGGNEEAARLAGVNTKKMRILTFVVSGFFVGVATIVFTSRMGSAAPGLASEAMFTCFSACVLGGISFRGGEGKVGGVVLGVFIFGVLSTGLQLIGLSIYTQYIVKGILLVAAIAFDNFQKTAQGRSLSSSL
jgi:ribose transport system permease protein